MLIDTSNPDLEPTLDDQQREWVYCGSDAACTRNLHDLFMPKIEADEWSLLNYNFNRALQPVAMLMQLRGVRVDSAAKNKALDWLWKEGELRRKDIDAEAMRLVGHGFKWADSVAPSPIQLMKLLYDELGVKEVRNRDGGRTTDKDALEKVRTREPKCERLCVLVQEARDLEKQIEVLEVGISADGRMRAMFNVGQAETDRWSSSGDPYGQGTNFQNLDERVRHIFVPDPGHEFLEVDLDQGESRCVAYLAGDERYIADHESGNVHVRASRNWWPELLANIPDEKAKALLKASQVPWVPKVGDSVSKSYYDVSKNRQHGFNYGRTGNSVAIMEHISQREGNKALAVHMNAYPGIARWHAKVKKMLLDRGMDVTPVGFRRQFFGNPKDGHTFKEALANGPQNMSVTILNIALYRVFKDLDPARITLFHQGHDSFMGQVKINDLTIRAEIDKRMRVPVEVEGSDGVVRTMVIPWKITTGKNWGGMK